MISCSGWAIVEEEEPVVDCFGGIPQTVVVEGSVLSWNLVRRAKGESGGNCEEFRDGAWLSGRGSGQS